MKHARCVALSVVVAVFVAGLAGCSTAPRGDGSMGAAPYRHVVLFKFKDDATPEQVRTVEQEFAKLPGKIDTIRGYEWGTNISPEDKAGGFTHCFVVSFDDQNGLDAYIPHAAHQAFVAVLRPSLDKVLVVDYIAREDAK